MSTLPSGVESAVIEYLSHSPAETIKIAGNIVNELKLCSVILLKGKMGAGKTHFVKGIAETLGIDSEKTITSPTFDIIHSHQIKASSAEFRIRILNHVDLYRINNLTDDDIEWLSEYWDAKNSLTVVEWGECLAEHLNVPFSTVQIEESNNMPNERIIRLSTNNHRP